MAAVLVQLEGQDGHPEFGRMIPYVTRPFSTTARSMHHATSPPKQPDRRRNRQPWASAHAYDCEWLSYSQC